MSQHGAPPFFVVGAFRSGTTLLRLMLNRHSRLCIPPESHFVVELHQKLGGRLDPEQFLALLVAHPRFLEYELDPKRVRELLSQAPRQWRDFFDVVYREYASPRGKARWGDKTPEYVRHLDVLDRIFPQCQVLHLIRDGRDVACSLKEVPWFHGDAAKAARRWRKRVERGRRAGRRLGPQRYRELRYERLVEAPEESLSDVCAFLGEPFETTMLQFYEDASEEIPGHRQAWHRETSRPVSGRRVARYRDDLSREDLVRFEAVAGGLLEELGYPPETWTRWRSVRSRILRGAQRTGHGLRRLLGCG